METRWRSAAAARARNRLRFRREAPVPTAPVAPEDIDTLEDVFATIQLPIGLLNIDYGGNNIRNISFAREVLADPTHASSKNRSDLKLLGFMREGRLTELGRRAARARTNEQVAVLWCRTTNCRRRVGGNKFKALGRETRSFRNFGNFKTRSEISFLITPTGRADVGLLGHFFKPSNFSAMRGTWSKN